MPKFRAVGQVGWNFPIEAIVLKVDGPKKGEVANVRGNGATQVMTL